MDVEALSALKSAQIQAQVQVSVQKQALDSEALLQKKLLEGVDAAPRAAGQTGQNLNVVA